MIKKILVANRGEIACRVFKTAKRLGLSTVAVYSDIDENAQHVKLADEAIRVGTASATDSYLKGDLIIQKALQYNVDAIHPGYGFLSENSDFAEKCQKNNIIFIGPNPSAIKAMGSKSAAKTIMQAANVPLVPGYHGDNQSPEFLHQQAQEMGYPVLLKAAAGGGGKGMRQVWEDKDFFEALDAAKRESKKSFADDIMLIEKYLTEPRHVEIQVFCDAQGNGVYLFERDCSVQRRHQKIIEEAPAPGLTDELRQEMGEAALKAASAIDYVGAGTVEFLLESDGSFYFMEMNTRLQVEHPVTEFITGEDLVEWQIRVADGKPLPKTQSELTISGHAFEARIYAEDPNNDFLPSTGLIELLLEPEQSTHVRVDTGVVSKDEVSIYYDPMIAKLVVHSQNREKALDLLIRSLKQYMICGLTSNIPYLIQVADSEPFRQAKLTTDFIDRHQDVLSQYNDTEADIITLSAVTALIATSANKSHHDRNHNNQHLVNYPGFRLNHIHTKQINFTIAENEYTVDASHIAQNTWRIKLNDQSVEFAVEKGADTVTLSHSEGKHTFRFAENDSYLWVLDKKGLVTVTKHIVNLGDEGAGTSSGDVTAPMNGTVVAMQVSVDQQVEKDSLLCIVEAMKMEHSLRAPFAGRVIACNATAGDLVDGGAVLVAIEAQE